MFSSICSSCVGVGESGEHGSHSRRWFPPRPPHLAPWVSGHLAPLVKVHMAQHRHPRAWGGIPGVRVTVPGPDLAECGLLVAQAHDEDAVGLAQAAHGPGRQRCVCLVEHDAVRVLLLGQPP